MKYDELSLQTTIPWTPLGLTDGETRILELRLVHEYTKSTTDMRSLGAMSPAINYSLWNIDIPQMAFSSDIVLNALLGLSALRLQGTNPDDAVLARASLFYLGKAVKKHQEALELIDEQSAEPLLVAAVLIAHYTWLSAHSKPPDERFSIDIRTYHMCRGIISLVEQARPWLDKYNPPKLNFKLPPISSPDQNRFISNAMQDLESLSAAFSQPSIPVEHKQLYETAAKKLADLYRLIAAGADTPTIEQSIVTYLHSLPPEFCNLLKEEDPLTMALHARRVCMLIQAEDSPAWWIQGAGEHKVAVKCVLGIQSLMPTEWQWTMDWPVKVVLKKVDLYSCCCEVKGAVI